MDKKYKHSDFEEKIYKQWEKSGGFAPDMDAKKTFTIIMPPPNANDPLHVGHAMFVTIEDILTRYHRMLGEAALWLPGTDHAGIETQFVFEKKLAKKDKSRFEYDRETLYKMIWDYVQENSDIAVRQLKKIGASADWSRFKFMLDPSMVKIVIETFKKLCKDGLVYRDLRLVNFCTKCGTAFSDLEVNHIEQKTPLYYMKYGPLTLATVRPETKFGDTAIEVHPDDKRYKKWIGKEVEVEGLLGKFKMKVIADSRVDMEFGTGVVKVTPAHDKNDFDVWLKHKGEIPGPKLAIGFDGKMTKLAGPYEGMRVKAARAKIVEDLKKKGLLVKTDENYVNNIGVCYRCNTVIEPLPLPQFFVKVKPLTKMALKALKEKKTVVYGAGHDKILKHWLKNLNDWNVSRQIVWGIRMPIWYKIGKIQDLGFKNQDIYVKFVDKKKRVREGRVGKLLSEYSLKEISDGLQELRAPVGAKYKVSPTPPSEDYLQETDTFDTWFSSAQFPYTTLMTTKKNDFEKFYPTSVMETGYDILPFWVMRMLFMGLYKTGKVPFESVYLHGLVRDEKGRKMAKSKGNVINPLEIIERHGADALRMALVMSTTAGKDSSTGEEKIRGMRNLTNKIWNAARFVMMDKEKNTEGVKGDEEFLKRLDGVVREVSKQLDDLKPGLAAETVYKEFWHWFCDECIESNKRQEISDKALSEGLMVFLKLLHPFVPYVTEAVWGELGNKGVLMNSEWPRTADARTKST